VRYLVAATCILAGVLPTSAQQDSSYSLRGIPGTPCPASSTSVHDQPSAPSIRVAEITFSGALQLSSFEQEQIAASIKSQPNIAGTSVDDVADLALELVREGWQDRGYFAVQGEGEARTLTSNALGQRIAINVHVDEGPLYSWGEITFKNNKALSDTSLLRRLFPMKHGDTFRRADMVTGLENLQTAYGRLGYINFTPVPTPSVDDQNRIVSFDIDIDESKQFRINDVVVLGLDETRKQDVLKAFPVGQIYDEGTAGEFFKQHSLDPEGPFVADRHQDERTGTIAISVDGRHCARQ
jgi:outer membrane protein insertion porin family